MGQKSSLSFSLLLVGKALPFAGWSNAAVRSILTGLAGSFAFALADWPEAVGARAIAGRLDGPELAPASQQLR